MNEEFVLISDRYNLTSISIQSSDLYSILETVGDARTVENIFTNEGCDEGVEWQYRCCFNIIIRSDI